MYYSNTFTISRWRALQRAQFQNKTNIQERKIVRPHTSDVGYKGFLTTPVRPIPTLQCILILEGSIQPTKNTPQEYISPLLCQSTNGPLADNISTLLRQSTNKALAGNIYALQFTLT